MAALRQPIHMTPVQALRKSLKDRFYPFAQARGFIRGKATSLFVPFKRVVDGNTQFFEIQWDKHHRPCFVINFGEHAGAQVSNDQLQPFGRLQRWHGGSMRTWFQTSKPWMETLRTLQWSYEPDEVVTQLMEYFPELENWWVSKQEGPHVYIWHKHIG